MALPYVESTNMDQDDLPRRRGVLFPIAPKSDESFFGFLFRTASWNSLKAAHLLQGAGVRAPPTITNIAARIDEVAQSLCIPPHILDQMLIGPREDDDTCTAHYFGMQLRQNHVSAKSRRVSPAALRDSPHHRAIWALNPVPYCHETWNLLIERCPDERCGAPLNWKRSCAIDHCARCGADLKEAPADTVAEQYRPTLRLFAELLHPNPATRAAACRAFPPPFRTLAPSALFEVILAFSRAAADGVLSTNYREGLHFLSEGVRIALEFPRSFWKIQVSGMANHTTPAFFMRLGDSSFLHADVEVGALVAEIVRSHEPTRHGPSRLRQLRERGGYLKLTDVAVELGVDNAAASRLVEAGFLTSTTARGDVRRIAWFKPDHVAEVKRRLGERLSFSEFSRQFGLPRSGLEQIVSLGLLALNDDPLVAIIRAGPQLRRPEALQLMETVRSVTRPPGRGVKPIALRDAFMGTGAREKPWAAIVHAAIERRLPGGLLMERGAELNFDNLALDDAVAIDLAGGQLPLLSEVPARAGALGPEPDFTRTEVEHYLNCFPRDVSWLLDHDHLTRSSPTGAHICRADVERLAQAIISSREIAWRWRVSPALRDALPDHGIQRVLGPFWPRQEVVAHFEALLPGRRAL